MADNILVLSGDPTMSFKFLEILPEEFPSLFGTRTPDSNRQFFFLFCILFISPLRLGLLEMRFYSKTKIDEAPFCLFPSDNRRDALCVDEISHHYRRLNCSCAAVDGCGRCCLYLILAACV